MIDNNLISEAFEAQDLAAIDAAIDMLQQSLGGKHLISLTPQQRKKYGRLGNETKNFAEMVLTDVGNNEALRPAFINLAEWQKDMKLYNDIYPRLVRLKAIYDKLLDTCRVAGYDISNQTAICYRNVRHLSEENVPEAITYYQKWKVQYDHAGKAEESATDPVL